jgi:hypothetical protein
MVVKYNFKLLDNNGTFIEYKDKTTNQMLKIINKHLEEKFNVDDDLLITRDMINNLMNNKSSSKYLKIFIKNIVKKKLDKDGNILETTTAN